MADGVAQGWPWAVTWVAWSPLQSQWLVAAWGRVREWLVGRDWPMAGGVVGGRDIRSLALADGLTRLEADLAVTAIRAGVRRVRAPGEAVLERAGACLEARRGRGDHLIPVWRLEGSVRLSGPSAGLLWEYARGHGWGDGMAGVVEDRPWEWAGWGSLPGVPVPFMGVIPDPAQVPGVRMDEPEARRALMWPTRMGRRGVAPSWVGEYHGRVLALTNVLPWSAVTLGMDADEVAEVLPQDRSASAWAWLVPGDGGNGWAMCWEVVRSR